MNKYGRGPKGSRLPSEAQARIRAALRMGVSMSETARRIGVTRDEVRTIGERAGLLARRPSRGGDGFAGPHHCPDCGQLNGPLHRCPRQRTAQCCAVCGEGLTIRKGQLGNDR